MRPRIWIPALTGAIACVGAAAALASGSPPSNVTVSVISNSPGTPAPGTVVPSMEIGGNRVFVNDTDGFALAAGVQSQFPVATTDGGTTWKVIGPALHINAAQAPLVVSNIGAASTKTIYAYGGGQAADVTTDGGKTWYRALFQGLVEQMTTNLHGHLVVYEQFQSGSPVQMYVSKDGGRHWKLTKALFGG